MVLIILSNRSVSKNIRYKSVKTCVGATIFYFSLSRVPIILSKSTNTPNIKVLQNIVNQHFYSMLSMVPIVLSKPVSKTPNIRVHDHLLK